MGMLNWMKAYFAYYSVNQYRQEYKAMDLSSIKFVPSPNFSKRTDQVRCIIFHHTGSTNLYGTVSWLCDPKAQASAHFVIDVDGTVNQLVKTEDASWNAGKSEWMLDGQKRTGLNNCSIGVELVNIGILEKGNDGKFYYEDGRNLKEWKGETPVASKITYPDGRIIEGFGVVYPDKQITSLIGLCKALVAKYPNLSKESILTHYEVALPSGRKNDPFGLNLDYIKGKIFES